MNEQELKPCPFCGHKPILRHDKITETRSRDNGDLITRWEVYRPNCGTTKDGGVSEYIFLSDETLHIKSNFDGRRNAIEKWNRRANDER